MTRIELTTANQKLINQKKVTLASGDIASVVVHIDFDNNWDDLPIRSATFHTSYNPTVYEVALTDDTCIVPAEVLMEKGVLYIGARGISTDAEAVKTSSLAKYNIIPGAIAGETTLNPTMDLYRQYLSELHDGLDPISQEIEQRIQQRIEDKIADFYAAATEISGKKEFIVTFLDYRKKICDLNMNGKDETWTATENCWVVTNTDIFVNGVCVSGSSDTNGGVCVYVAVPVEKGSVVHLGGVSQKGTVYAMKG